MALTKKQRDEFRSMELLEKAGAALAAGFDPVQVFKHCGHWAFDPAAEQIAKIHRRRKAADVARGAPS